MCEIERPCRIEQIGLPLKSPSAITAQQVRDASKCKVNEGIFKSQSRR